MKLLASDFDGSLYFRQKKPSISKKDLESIKSFRKKHIFGLSTGRSREALLSETNGLIDLDFYILNNGALILDKDLSPLYEKAMDVNVVKEILGLYSQEKSVVIGEDITYLYLHDKGLQTTKTCIINDFDQIDEKNILGFSISLSDEKKAQKVCQEINDMDLGVRAFQNLRVVDCSHEENSKGLALQIIQDHFKIKDKNMAAIGDAYNDLPMLDLVENSFTFHHAKDPLKARTKYVVDSVSQAIEILKED